MTTPTITTLGSQWKAYYADNQAWPTDAYHDDTQVLINGIQDDNADLGAVADTDVLQVVAGYVYMPDGKEYPLVEHFQKWFANQTTDFGSFSVPKHKLQAVLDAIRIAGGTPT